MSMNSNPGSKISSVSASVGALIAAILEVAGRDMEAMAIGTWPASRSCINVSSTLLGEWTLCSAYTPC